MHMNIKNAIGLFAGCLGLAACTIGPDYRRPVLDLPSHFKEEAGWKPATPDTPATGSRWWSVFADPALDTLEQQIPANLLLVQAEAQFRQSTALAAASQASLLPRLNFTANYNRFLSPVGQSPVFPGVRQIFNTALTATWELDLWGRIRRQIEAGEARAIASADNRDALRLSLQAQLAQNYFQLRTLDVQKRVLDDSITAFRKTLELTRNRYEAGVVSKADVVQAETQLSATEAQAIDLAVQRQSLEHAIAVLIGKAPVELTLEQQSVLPAIPGIPAAVPASLLERRPDIAAAELQMMAANAEIGAARAAFFPNITLNANTGVQNNTLARLLSTASHYWALGPLALALPLFEGGAKNAELKRARAGWDVSVAGYRQTLLQGFQEVEDNLAALHLLSIEARFLDDSLKTGQEAVRLALNQYQAGTVSFQNVLIAQTQALANEREAVGIHGRQLVAAVNLIKALGGGWEISDKPGSPLPDRTWRHYLPVPDGTDG